MARWVEFTADHDHTWPSRAMTAFKAGQMLFVKNEVAEAAIEKGRARPATKPGDSADEEAYDSEDAAPPEAPDGPGTDGVAEPHDADHVGVIVRDEADASAAER